MKILLKTLLILLGIVIIFIGGFYLFMHFAFDGILTGPSYDKQDLIDNYEKRKTEIIEVKTYIESKIPENTYIVIEFGNDKIDIFHIKKNEIDERNWDLDINSKKTDSLLSIIRWNKSDLISLKNKLDKANCISVATGSPTVIGWQRSGMGKYYYNIYNQDLTDSLINHFRESCSHIYYKENIVLEYGGGAISSDCFLDYEREKGNR